MKGIISIILFRSLFATIHVTTIFCFPCALGFTTTSFQSFNRVTIRQQTISTSRMNSTTTTTNNNNSNNNNNDEPRWCPEEQIYIGGVPENAEVKELIQKEGGYLRLFGYGSLCWNPGGGVLANSKVTSKLGRARGYRRCWAQRSTDHRGTTKFPGIVCTLLADSEVDHIRQEATAAAVTQQAEEEKNLHHHHHGNDHHDQEATMTEGVIYLIPPNLVDECLEELDFREKGGYARDVIDVIEDETGELHQALLYRGTPDNPAFWSRALLDLDYAAATMSVAVGPSGKNDVYLNSLDEFLRNAHTIAAEKDDTNRLSAMARKFQTDYQPYFLYGCGSNQHNQLLLDRPNNASNLRGDDCHEMKEILVCTPRTRVSETTRTTTATIDKPKAIYAGGGHSGLLTTSGNLYLWGWNESGQCSTTTTTIDSTTSKSPDIESSLPLVSHLPNLNVEKAALGFSHTLIVERETNQLYTFGNNERGQVDGNPSTTPGSQPTVPPFLKDERIKAVAAGLFHSAVVTMDGEVITFGCSRFGQALPTKNEKGDAWIDRWRPNDGSKAVDVVCGRRHTLVVDDRNRIWSFGENKYGQLGRQTDGKFDPIPALVDGCVKDFPKNSIIHLNSGWSHNVIRVELPVENGDNIFYGWGRNDKGQLGVGTSDELSSIPTPQIIFEGKELQLVSCSSESTLALDRKGQIFGCGWNEHGNLATGDQEDKFELHPTVGEKVVSPPVYDFDNPTIAIAAGGAHFLSCIVEKTNLS